MKIPATIIQKTQEAIDVSSNSSISESVVGYGEAGSVGYGYGAGPEYWGYSPQLMVPFGYLQQSTFAI